MNNFLYSFIFCFCSSLIDFFSFGLLFGFGVLCVWILFHEQLVFIISRVARFWRFFTPSKSTCFDPWCRQYDQKAVIGSFKTYFLPKSIQKHLRYKWGWITNVFLQGETSRQFSHIKVYLCSPLISDSCSWSSRSWVCYKPDLLHAIWWPQQLLLEWNVQYVLLRWHCVCLPRGSWAKDGTFDFISALGRWWWFSKVN